MRKFGEMGVAALDPSYELRSSNTTMGVAALDPSYELRSSNTTMGVAALDPSYDSTHPAIAGNMGDKGN